MTAALRQSDALNSRLNIDVWFLLANYIHFNCNAAIASMTRWLSRW
jgi:hypothetical protein